MSNLRGSKPSRASGAAPGPAAKTPALDQAVPVPKKPSTAPRTKDSSSKSTKPTSPSKTVKSPHAAKIPGAQAEDKQPQLQSVAAALSNDETEEVQVVPPEAKTEIDICAICLDDCTEPKQLDKCSHTFCTACIDHYFQAVKPQCPCCFTIYGEIRGNQPNGGTMTHTILKNRLPGFENDAPGTIQITYTFPDGIQDESHPNPSMPYSGTTRTAYLPNNHEGQHVLKLLQQAFNLRQIFTIGQSRTTGSDNVLTWNDIHHKTRMNGGMEKFGYPDKTYLNRVQQELAAKGIK